eukprot:TRINITY_DN2793_c0_g1_i2.p1 TRINITY_DN2793_c0_g1~~TRINITY_DN2793_c0_g1_i2.p1  ORF type:complete len:432 (+),score=64.37 TRINITY_DN2793_c0_g1_i2:35-1330(+)
MSYAKKVTPNVGWVYLLVMLVGHGLVGQVDSVQISEIMASSTEVDGNWVELYNPSDLSVDLTSWRFQLVYSLDYLKYSLSHTFNNTVIGGRSFLVIPESQLGFKLVASGGTVHLRDPTKADVEKLTMRASPPGYSYGKYYTSLKSYFILLSNATKGFSNNGTSPLIPPLVITDFLYWPGPEDVAYFVVQNYLDVPVYLFYTGDDTHAPSPRNTWRIRGSISYNFPQQVILGPKRKLIVSSVEPSLFISRYNVPSWVQVFGPWEGAFNYSSASIETRIALAAPIAPSTFSGSSEYYRIDTVQPTFEAPWPPGAVATGGILVRQISNYPNGFCYGDEPSCWMVKFTPSFYDAPPNDGWIQPLSSTALPKNPKTPHTKIQDLGLDTYSFSQDNKPLLFLACGIFAILLFGGLVISFFYIISMTKPKTVSAAPTD